MIAALNDNHFISKEEQYLVPGFITLWSILASLSCTSWSIRNSAKVIAKPAILSLQSCNDANLTGVLF